MKQRFYVKFSIIFALILALLIPQSFIMDLVSERTSWRQQAYDSIEQSWPGRQTLAGPVLLVPYHLTYNSKEKIIVNKVEKSVIKEVTVDDILYLIPKQLNINSKLESSMRYRGIYEIPVYGNGLQVTGEFDNQALLNVIADNKDKKIRWDKPQLSVLVSDQRGIAAPPALKWNNSDIAFQPSANLPHASAGMHADLPQISVEKAASLPFAFNMELRGMRAMSFSLLSENSQVQLAANWANPSFMGELLPEKRDINPQGFSAEWKASSFSYDVSNALEQCRKGECNSLLNRAVGFELIQPVDVYQQSERSIKYAALFIILTFMALVLFELLKKLPIHPIQYTLVGMALLVFYLLLISLSEHLLFIYAYSIGASASILLLTVYFGAILHSHKSGLILGAALAVLYGVLYVILQSEENSLLMGSVLIFIMLAGLMLTTRHFDWYALTASNDKTAANTD